MNRKYKTRIDQALQYIEENLSKRILLTDVAKVSHFSPYHFHRIFTGIVGETINDYIARRRLERAINTLIFKPDLSMTQVALGNGFSSSANFSKAVKLYFGFSPSEIRNPDKIKDSKIGKIYSKYGKDFNPSDLYPTRLTNEMTSAIYREDTIMNIEVRDIDGYRVCALPSTRGYESKAIYEAWDKLIGWAASNGIKRDEQQRFAFAFDNPTVTPIDKCRYEAAIVIGSNIQVNPPFNLSEIPKGKYAVLYFKGSPEETIKAQLSIYSDWLPDSGFEPDNFPMLEHYLNDVRVDGHIEMEIHVKLKAMVSS
ncbi:AraC family transcriptional regulator [Endozoicomonas sp. SM1973]|uniref:AraC family transcriptional regulator n=1 Tax=Spartinivicinus marinus TaxID=2994442 RepID=A0A853IMQ7_9GAMM|nr:GyrI-like domain-containing protein [Spartinivicinus marinus]MCX4028663.1 GyrI-like domain-containing protein [Spartinivicinus marinus]NYZ69076.1 AraC family transcriptional regulator [Spartinivicinus marinus]